MTDFLLSSRPGASGVLRMALEAFLGPVTAQVAEHRAPWGALAVATPWPERGPLVAENGVASAVAGEPIVHASGVESGIVTAGPLRSAVHALLSRRDDVGWDAHVDGQFAAVGVDESGAGIVVTDLMGFIPVFYAVAEDGFVIGTHPDAVAVASGQVEVDPASAADLAATRSIAYPHTLYRGVFQMAPGTARRFGPRGWTDEGRPYWVPEERDGYASLGEAAHALRAALAEDVRIAVRGLERAAILLSAGEDSRAILGAVPPGVAMDAFVYADSENREVKVARKAARAYGATLTFGPRSPDHYLGVMESLAAIVGSSHVFLDAHGFGFHRSLGLADYRLVLGGYSSDSHLKDAYVRNRPVRLSPLPGVRPELLEEVRSRHEAHLARVTALRPRSGGEWYRLWPFSQRQTGANVDGNRRLFHIHEPFHANALVKLAAVVPQAWKRDRKLFHAAVRPFLARSWYVPHAGSRFPYFGKTANVFLGAGLRAWRALERAPGNQGPWARWSDPRHAEPIARLEARIDVPGSPVAAAFADEALAFGQPLREWGYTERFALMQAAHLSSRARALADSVR